MLQRPGGRRRQHGRVRRSLLLALSLTALAVPAQTRAAQARDPLAAVPAVRVVRPGFALPATPAYLNVNITVRYARTARPRAVLLLMPGLLGGAGSFDRLARQLVTRDPTLAVWAVDRRAYALEPQSQIARADPATLARIAREGLPATPAAQLKFMQDWGLDTTLRDWRVAVQEAKKLTPNVFIGGHSLGGVLTGLYAAYDFDGTPGFADVKGLVMLDGVLGSTAARPLTEVEYQTGFTELGLFSPGLTGLVAKPYLQTDFFGPVTAARAAAQARLAARTPLGLSPSGLAPVPATNLAAALLQLERRYSILSFLAVTTGRATNTTEGPNLAAFALNPTFNPNSARVTGLIDPKKPAGWQQDPGAPTDAQDLVNRFWLPTGDFSEWYFPARLTLDISAAGTGTLGTPFSALRVYHDPEVNLPVLGLAAQNGLTSEDQYRAYARRTRAQLSVQTLPGYAHLDVVTARSDTVAARIDDWLKGIAR